MGWIRSLLNWNYLASEILSKKIIGWFLTFFGFMIMLWGVQGMIVNETYMHIIAAIAGGWIFFSCAGIKIRKQDRSIFAPVFEEFPIN